MSTCRYCKKEYRMYGFEIGGFCSISCSNGYDRDLKDLRAANSPNSNDYTSTGNGESLGCGGLIGVGIIWLTLFFGFLKGMTIVFPDKPVRFPEESKIEKKHIKEVPKSQNDDRKHKSKCPIIDCPLPKATRATLSSTNSTTPDSLVQNYFMSIKNGQYQKAWDMLPSDMQRNKFIHPNGYSSFTDWWKKTSIDVDAVKIVSQSDREAIVNADVRYKAQKGSPHPLHLKYFLKRNSSTDNWVINKIKS
jgi:hypothetical protein